MASSPGDALRGFINALGAADAAAIDDLLAMSQPVLWIGTDPEEWWDDRAHILEVFQIQLKEMGGPSVSVGDVLSGEHGDAGWAATQATVSIPDGPTIPMRITAACVREDGSWRIVQGHASIGAGNEETIGTDLTV